MHSISFVLNTPRVISHCFLPVSKCTPSTGAGTKANRHPDSWFHIKNCFENFCLFSSDYMVAHLEGQDVMRKNSQVSCILIISTEFNSEMRPLQRVLANSPEDNPKSLLICKELKKRTHFFFLLSVGKHKQREQNQWSNLWMFSVGGFIFVSKTGKKLY